MNGCKPILSFWEDVAEEYRDAQRGDEVAADGGVFINFLCYHILVVQGED